MASLPRANDHAALQPCAGRTTCDSAEKGVLCLVYPNGAIVLHCTPHYGPREPTIALVEACCEYR